eukprot:875067-Lingulodinium_polyedra.AAC.1
MGITLEGIDAPFQHTACGLVLSPEGGQATRALCPEGNLPPLHASTRSFKQAEGVGSLSLH